MLLTVQRILILRLWPHACEQLFRLVVADMQLIALNSARQPHDQSAYAKVLVRCVQQHNRAHDSPALNGVIAQTMT